MRRFHVELSALGCVTTDHVVKGADEGDDSEQVLRVLRLQRPNVCYQVRACTSLGAFSAQQGVFRHAFFLRRNL